MTPGSAVKIASGDDAGELTLDLRSQRDVIGLCHGLGGIALQAGADRVAQRGHRATQRLVGRARQCVGRRLQLERRACVIGSEDGCGKADEGGKGDRGGGKGGTHARVSGQKVALTEC